VGAAPSLTGVIVLMLGLVLAPQLRQIVRKTRLVNALRWVFVVHLAWASAWIFTVRWKGGPASVDIAWYVTAVLLLVPGIAALGARSDLARVWNVFVLLPLVLVFSWPWFVGLVRGRGVAAWNVEEPFVSAYALVLIMGVGNYVGGRHTVSALMLMAAAMALVMPLSPGTARFAPPAGVGRLAATVLAVAAAGLAVLRAKAGRTGPPADQAWREFRDLFGNVWSARVLERVNEQSLSNAWSIRLTTSGFVTLSGGAELAPIELRQASALLRWHLQKFVTQEWLDERLGPARDAA
jgi:hypothetical protein